MAVLDELPPGLLDPKTAGMLQAAFGMMQASGPSRTPVSLGQVIGQGGQQGMGAYNAQMQQLLAHQRQQVAQKLAQDQLNEQQRFHNMQGERFAADAQRDRQAADLLRRQTEYISRPDIKHLLILGKYDEVLAGLPGLSPTNIVNRANNMQPKAKEESPLARLRREMAALPTDDVAGRAEYAANIRKLTETERQISPTVVMPRNPQWLDVEDPLKPGWMIKINPELYDEAAYLAGNKKGVIGRSKSMTQAGLIDAKTQLAMTGLGADLQSAEDLLTGVRRTSDGQVVKGNLPTGSGIGSLLDKAAGWFGVSPEGAEEADSLKTVAARLVGRVPRFEGPQSDKDVSLYKEAAGRVGDDDLPRPRRLAALRTMREIYAGYESGQRGRLLGDSGSGRIAPKPTLPSDDNWKPLRRGR